MKKGFALFLAMILLASLAAAGAEPVTVTAPSGWADPENDRAAVDVLPAEMTVSGENGKLVMQIIWADSAWDEWVFTLVLTPETVTEDKIVYSYINGTAYLYSYDDDGNKVSETASNEALSGTVTAERDGNGEVVLRLESGSETLQNLTLHRELMPCPMPEELAANVIEPILDLEEGTTGSELKTAKLAARLLHFAVEHRLYAVDPSQFSLNMKAALKELDLSEAEYQMFLDKKNRVTDLLMTICGLAADDSGEKAANAVALCTDAGVAGEIDILLDSSLSASHSADLMLISLETIENEEAE